MSALCREVAREHGRRRKWERVVIKAIRAYLDAGGLFQDILKLRLVAGGIALPGYEADCIGTEVGDITSELLAETLQLTHPDKHPVERRELAKRVTQELLALKPFVFPKPQPTPAPPHRRRRLLVTALRKRTGRLLKRRLRKRSRSRAPRALTRSRSSIARRAASNGTSRWLSVRESQRQAARLVRTPEEGCGLSGGKSAGAARRHSMGTVAMQNIALPPAVSGRVVRVSRIAQIPTPDV